MRTSHVPVLVIGAGAAGTMVTLELARRGVRVRTVDRLPRPTSGSNAFVVHARTLELFERIDERLVARFLDRGIRCKGYALHSVDAVAGRRGIRPAVDFTALDSRYPFLLVHRQSETERYLREYTGAHFGVSPDWSTRCVDVREVEDGIVATLESDGAEEEVHSRYLVACDGAQSRVRELIGLGPEPEQVADSDGSSENLDAVLDGFAGEDGWVHCCAGSDHLFVIARLPGGFYRLQRGVEGEAADDASAAETARAFQVLLDRHFDGVRLGEFVAHTWWRRPPAQAPAYRRSRAFFVGDAAYGHSATGGLGLDRALQDGSNLAWKLAFVLKGLAPPELLESYDIERRPVAAQVDATAKALQAAFAGHDEGAAADASLAVRCSGIAFDYREATAASASAPSFGGPAVGAYAVDVEFDRGRTLVGLMRQPWCTLLGMAASEQGRAGLETLLAPLGRRFAAVLAVRIIGPSATLARCYGASATDRLWLVRPDGYVGFKCGASEVAALETWLAERFVS
jgi:2-polyprenyl-6-methoxyphenol hydroxylase-like FAD-dependent oxidoreductase